MKFRPALGSGQPVRYFIIADIYRFVPVNLTGQVSFIKGFDLLKSKFILRFRACCVVLFLFSAAEKHQPHEEYAGGFSFHSSGFYTNFGFRRPV